MKHCFAYIRVSTAKQGEQGVSLQEQRGAIDRFAERNALKITEWYEERETAAKRGRPVFNQMLKRLKKAEADGVIIHKIDRSARNLRDWADLGEMIDKGIEVYFANESLDLHTRGGRLSADIQAVVAADFIRNLKEETRKGFYGRIKQGLYPLPAPVGYLNQGKGEPKIPDPVKAPLVRKVFEMYASARYSLFQLADAAFAMGLRNRKRRRISRNGLSVMLNNPFYIGLIYLRRNKQTFQGVHEPIVKASTFKMVQAVLQGKTVVKETRQAFLFRRLLKCGQCGYSLIGERQKGHVYYRCQTRTCAQKCVREEDVDRQIGDSVKPLVLDKAEQVYLLSRVAALKLDWFKTREEHKKAVTLNVKSIEGRLSRLTDVYLDSAIDREMFEHKKSALLLEKRQTEDRITNLGDDSTEIPDTLGEFLELAKSAYLRYELANPDEKRQIVENVTSNRIVNEKYVVVELRNPFREVALRTKNPNGGPYRDRPRTGDAGIWTDLDVMIEKVSESLKKEPIELDWAGSDSEIPDVAA